MPSGSGFALLCLNAECCSILVLQAEKAEGYIDLTNFMIDRAIECKKKQ